VRFRKLRESDHTAIAAVVDGWWSGRPVADKLPHLFFRLFRKTSFAVEEGGELVGFLVGVVGRPAEEAYVHFVGVHPGYRSRGIGRRLYEEFFEEAGRQGCRSVRAITSPVNRASIAFHGRMGFEVVEGDLEMGGVSVHSNYDGDGKEKVVFWRNLS
jgi:ribosomal protein S18 acetylase RimI-like enzyme